MGSHGYAAPEVFSKASTADHRADIYSLGVLLYQMLTGDLPRGMFKLPSQKVPGLDARFDAIICQAMEEGREERQQSVAEMCELLSAVRSPCRERLLATAESDRALTKITQQVALRRRIAWGRVAMAGVMSALVLGGMVGLVISHMHSDDQETSLEPSDPSFSWKNMLKNDGGVLRRSLQGNWVSIDGSIHGPPASAAQPSLCGLSWDETGACDLRFRITKLSGEDGLVHLGFRHGESSGGILFSDQRQSHRVSFVGMTTLNGANADRDSSWVRRQTASFLPIGQAREIRLLLRDEGMAAWIDGVEVYRWKGDWKQLSQSLPLYLSSLTRRQVFAIGSHRAQIAIHSAEAMRVTGDEGKTLPEVPPVEFRGHRYQYIPGAFTWMEAEANAASLGGHLATLTSAEENHWVWTQFSPHLSSQDKRALPERGWWIGGKPLESGNGWQWVTGDPFEYTCWSLAKPPAARTPRLRQHNNAGGGGLSAWSPVHYSNRCGYLVEWDSAAPAPATAPTVTDQEVRKLAAWLFTLPLSSDPVSSESHGPDLLLKGESRNLRKFSELPAGPLVIGRVRIGTLHVDAAARKHLEILSRVHSISDLRMNAIDDGRALSCVRDLTRLYTFVFKAASPGPLPLPDAELIHLERLSFLNSLRIEGWSSFTGRGLSLIADKRRLTALSLNLCPDLNDEGLAQVARFTGLTALSLTGTTKITDAGLQQLKKLRGLKTLTLAGTAITAKGIADLKTALPEWEIKELPEG